jgi:AraC-like DNA-binding protein
MLTVVGPGDLRVMGARDGTVSIAFVLSGDFLVRTSAGSLQVRAGVGWFYGSSVGFTAEWAVPTTMATLTVPREALAEFGAGAAPDHDCLSAPPLLLDPARRFVESVALSEASGGGVATYVVERLLLEMAGSLVLSEASVDAARRPDRGDLRKRAERMLAARYTDGAYGPARLAGDMSVSLRQLQRAFAAAGPTPAAALADVRREQAVRLLRDPLYRALDMGEVAAHCGFRSARQLREQLGRAGMGTPRSHRGNGTP